MDRRRFLGCAASVPVAVAGSRLASPLGSTGTGEARADPAPVTLFLCGDVMTGRGLDQVLPSAGDPSLHEPYVRSAARYVELAEAENGPIPAPVDYSYPWGDALAELDRVAPDARIINLETSVTTSARWWRGKGIHYRMHPGNAPCLAAAAVDCCVLANNHVIDWGLAGLQETLEVLNTAGIQTAGAGLDSEEAAAPATLEVGGGRRVLVFGSGTETSGIPADWAAGPDRPGVNLLADLSPKTARRIAEGTRRVKSDGSVVVASIHWGSNWGYAVPAAQREFAHRLIEEAGVDLVHGHSSHHFKGIEVHRGRPILYGCGDFLNDYEGISGHEEYRTELVLLYFPVIDGSTGRLVRFHLSPMRIRRFRLDRPALADIEWVRNTLNREGERFGTWVEAGSAGDLELRWT
jgi:poly-gamma-glutamate synthesis protein (capsule biosynthesis protein)